MALPPFSEEVMRFWNGWEVRALVLLSLFVQIILIIFGSRRKCTRIIWVNLLVWLAYLMADWVATLALGTLARSRGSSEQNSLKPSSLLHAFWAPFLLVHLGGPDTITAYSLEDNELWLRHFLELMVQVGVAFYIFIPSWKSNTVFGFLAIPVFITGILKYGERTLVLWSSSAKQLKDSLRSSSDDDPDVARMNKIMRIEMWRKMQRGESATSSSDLKPEEATTVADNSLTEAFLLFGKFQCLHADLILDHYERKESFSVITRRKSAGYAFELVDIELGLMYDTLYTKASKIYSGFGIFLRCVSIVVHVFVSFIFLFIIDKHAYSRIDISITCVLLIGAFVLEVYAFIMNLMSDWTRLWLTKHNLLSIDGSDQPITDEREITITDGSDQPITDEREIPITDGSDQPIKIKNRRWSGSMGQYNLLRFCLADISAKTSRVQKLFGIKELLEKYQYSTWEDVNVDLQEMIFKQVLKNAKKIENDVFEIKVCKELLAQRGDNVLSESSCLDEFRWSTTDVEFDQSLLLWHIATDLCYHADFDGHVNANKLPIESKISRWLSNYLLYLLVACPTMLPKGIGEIRYRHTCAKAKNFFKRQNFGASTKINKACKMLLEDPLLDESEGHTSLSVLFDGCKLAKELQHFFSNGETNNVERKWEMISKVWVEMLGYAANHCGWKEHGQQLMRGGELLTHICLLMAHLGLSEQYQLQKQKTHHHFRTYNFGFVTPLRETIRSLHNFGLKIRIPPPCLR